MDASWKSEKLPSRICAHFEAKKHLCTPPAKGIEHSMIFRVLVFILLSARCYSVASNEEAVTNGLSGDKLPFTKPQNSFSACLLVMDDNHKLTEWIAYHYYSLNLRHLVITTDPHSKTSLKPVLDRWRNRIVIEEWTDANFMRNKLPRNPKHSQSEAHEQHKLRQRKFYNKCIRYLKKYGDEWTIFVDTDEFVTLNVDKVTDAHERMQNPGFVGDYFVRLNREVQESPNHELREHFGKKCVLLPRTLYGTVESTAGEISQDVPAKLDPRKFNTLRWRHRATQSDKWLLTKGIVNVSQLTTRQELRSRATAHKPSALGCKGSNHWVPYSLPIGIHHYLGSWESYSFRDDARTAKHNYEDWKSKSQHAYTTDDSIRSWIRGFVEMVGEDDALELLQGIGEQVQ